MVFNIVGFHFLTTSKKVEVEASLTLDVVNIWKGSLVLILLFTFSCPSTFKLVAFTLWCVSFATNSPLDLMS